jgi:hypothetical protein
MNEIKTNKGVLKYRMPNSYELSDVLQIIMSIKKSQDDRKALRDAERDIMEVSVEMIDESSVGYGSKQEMINDVENMFIPIKQVASEITNFALGLYDKKKE